MTYLNEDNYKRGMQEFKEIMPNAAEAYHTFTGICFEEGEVSKKHKELIALGISLSHRDDNCVKYHVTEALHKGATEEEIWETVNVAIALSGGMAISQSVHWVSEAISTQRTRQ